MDNGLLSAFLAVLQRDLILVMRRMSDALHPLLFFVMVISLFPLGVGPDIAILRMIAPGIIWVAALLAALLSLEPLFRSDFDDGSLEQLLLSPHPLPVLIFAKILAHWLVTGLPLLLMAPVLALSLGMPNSALPTLMFSLLLGTPALSLVGSVGVALTVGLRRAGLLLVLLLIPLYVPVLIFATGAVGTASKGLPAEAHLYMLASLLLLALTLAPFACAAALKVRMS